MTQPSYTKFKGVTQVYRDLETQNLLHGVMDFLRYGFLEVGAFENVSMSSSGVYGGNKSYLRPVKDPRFSDYQAWEGFRGDWVWESGLDYATQPTQISGVWVGGSFYGPADATYGHYVDYARGRIVFNSALSSSLLVQEEFAHRTVGVVQAEHPFIRHLMYESFRVDKSDFDVATSGAWNYLGDYRVQLPCVGVKIVPEGSYSPYQIGGGQWGNVSAKLYIFADSAFQRDQITDIIARQNDKTIWIANRGLMKESGVYPYDLDYRGSLVDFPLQYPNLISNTNWQWRKIQFRNTSKQTIDSNNDWLYRAAVTTTFEIVLLEI